MRTPEGQIRWGAAEIIRPASITAIDMQRLRFTCLILFFAASNASAGVFGPSNYDECILDGMKGVTSDVAANSIRRACRDKYPSVTELPGAAVKKLDGMAGVSKGELRGNIYNGNPDWSVTQITVVLVPSAAAAKTIQARQYNVNVYIKPLSNGSLYESVDGRFDDATDWNIIKARGEKIR